MIKIVADTTCSIPVNELEGMGAADFGELYYNSAGLFLKFSCIFN